MGVGVLLTLFSFNFRIHSSLNGITLDGLTVPFSKSFLKNMYLHSNYFQDFIATVHPRLILRTLYLLVTH